MVILYVTHVSCDSYTSHSCSHEFFKIQEFYVNIIRRYKINGSKFRMTSFLERGKVPSESLRREWPENLIALETIFQKKIYKYFLKSTLSNSFLSLQKLIDVQKAPRKLSKSAMAHAGASLISPDVDYYFLAYNSCYVYLKQDC